MRILIVADIVGGVRTFVQELVPELAERGLEVHLALLGPAEQAVPLQGLPVASCEVRELALEWMPGGMDDVPRAVAWIEELCVRHRPDVVHLNTFAPISDPRLPVVLTVHSCVLSWWRAVHGEDAPGAWDSYRRLAAAALERAAVVVTPTASLLSQLRALYGPLAHGRTIANGSALEAHRGAGRQPLVLSAGRLWDAGKNVAALASAAPLIDGEVAVVGAGTPDGLRHLGELPREEVVGWMRRARVFAEPARYEPFGLAALEAARSGCALVLGDIPSLREVWGQAADYVGPDDPAALAAAINRLLGDPRYCADAARAALRASRRYTPEAVGAAYATLFRSLVAVSA